MELVTVFRHAAVITFFVFVMMLLVDFVDAASKRRMSEIIRGGPWRQYTLASFFGSTPGCLGAFMNVSLYVHGMISFGAIVGGMIATSGDEAFVMLAQFPGSGLALFVMLFVSGILFAWVSDNLVMYHELVSKLGVIEVLNERLCFCKRDVMSICTAESEREQKNCKFYKKSSYTDRCMYLMFDEYCDCLEAQVASQQNIQEDYHWI